MTVCKLLRLVVFHFPSLKSEVQTSACFLRLLWGPMVITANNSEEQHLELSARSNVSHSEWIPRRWDAVLSDNSIVKFVNLRTLHTVKWIHYFKSLITVCRRASFPVSLPTLGFSFVNNHYSLIYLDEDRCHWIFLILFYF